MRGPRGGETLPQFPQNSGGMGFEDFGGGFRGSGHKIPTTGRCPGGVLRILGGTSWELKFYYVNIENMLEGNRNPAIISVNMGI